MVRILSATLRACAFLTRLPPVASAFAGGPHPLGGDAYAFPLVGIVAALGPAGLLLALDAAGLSPFAACTLAVLALVALTGALHEDGLGDTADGLFGHRSAAEALAIMKDSRVGTYGALALVGSLLARVALLADLASDSAGLAALALLASAAASRGAMAWLWSALPTADAGGLADRMGRPTPACGRISLGIGFGLALVVGVGVGGVGAALLPLGLAGLALAGLHRVLAVRLGGQTGDTLGAAQQLTETALLLGFALTL